MTITERMHQQRMTVFDLPMSYVYGGVAFGCFLMLFRQPQNVWRNAATAGAGPTTSRTRSRRLRDRAA